MASLLFGVAAQTAMAIGIAGPARPNRRAGHTGTTELLRHAHPSPSNDNAMARSAFQDMALVGYRNDLGGSRAAQRRVAFRHTGRNGQTRGRTSGRSAAHFWTNPRMGLIRPADVVRQSGKDGRQK